MTWMTIENPDIDADKLRAEIEREVAELKKKITAEETGEVEPGPISVLTEPDEEAALIEIAELYAAGWDAETIKERKPILKPFLPLIDQIFKRLLKPQYVFNSLLLEIVRKLEERIRDLEEHSRQ